MLLADNVIWVVPGLDVGIGALGVEVDAPDFTAWELAVGVVGAGDVFFSFEGDGVEAEGEGGGEAVEDLGLEEVEGFEVVHGVGGGGVGVAENVEQGFGLCWFLEPLCDCPTEGFCLGEESGGHGTGDGGGLTCGSDGQVEG